MEFLSLALARDRDSAKAMPVEDKDACKCTTHVLTTTQHIFHFRKEN